MSVCGEVRGGWGWSRPKTRIISCRRCSCPPRHQTALTCHRYIRYPWPNYRVSCCISCIRTAKRRCPMLGETPIHWDHIGPMCSLFMSACLIMGDTCLRILPGCLRVSLHLPFRVTLLCVPFYCETNEFNPYPQHPHKSYQYNQTNLLYPVNYQPE